MSEKIHNLLKIENDKTTIFTNKELKSCNKVARLFDTTGENIRQVLIRNNIEKIKESE